MKFEKQMKKHIDKTLEENVPNPYPKKKATFPHWLKIAIPATTSILAASIAVAIVIPNINFKRNNVGDSQSSRPDSSIHIPHALKSSTIGAPKHLGVNRLDTALVRNTAATSLMALDSYFKDANNQNFVLSPASYLLVSSALISVSDGFDLERFGLTNAKNDTKKLLEHWNSYWAENDRTTMKFDSGVLHQQVGDKFEFDPEKAQEFEDVYIATSKASRKDYVKQAEEYFKETIGITVPIPDVELPNDGGVVSYAAIKMIDLAFDEFVSGYNDFYVGGEKKTVDTACLGNQYFPLENVPYFANEQYEVFSIQIGGTSLAIILPAEGVSLESISVSEAYINFLSRNRTFVRAYGYVPYFNLKTDAFEFTDTFLNNMTSQERFYSKLLKNPNALVASDPNFYICAKQSSAFEFCKYGVSGESVSAIGTGASSAGSHGEPIELNVDRPFYAISLEDNFPLFVNKVNDPSK